MRTIEKLDEGKDKCPRHIIAEVANRIGDRREWFRKWVQAEESWMRAMLTETISEADELESGIIQAWLTEDHIIDHYNSEVVGKAVVL